jgi:hypothetical protein
MASSGARHTYRWRRTPCTPLSLNNFGPGSAGAAIVVDLLLLAVALAKGGRRHVKG